MQVRVTDPQPSIDARLDIDLVRYASECRADPLRFVRLAFPWGKAVAGLEGLDGPDEWQCDILRAIGAGVFSPKRAIQLAVASGHGIGKSALVAWIILWAITTCADARGVVTANTAAQLSTKTWPELVRWFRCFLWREWFEVSATAIYSSDPDHAKTWRIDAIPWSTERTEAFAGLHNQGKRILAVFDEASSIPDAIWETAEGALTDADTDIVWFVAGNPTRNTGRFRECFGRLKHRWQTRQIDSRTVRITNKSQIAEWVEDFGEDSDFVRIRVRGVFPRAGTAQFIGADLIEAARTRQVITLLDDALILGVDVAFTGVDQSVIAARKGVDARSIPWVKLRTSDLMQVAAAVADTATRYRADAVFVDVGGVGAGVYSRLLHLNVRNVQPIQFGGRANRLDYGENPVRAANKRAEMWSAIREWLAIGGIPDDAELVADLAGPEFTLNVRDELLLESKDSMRRRGLSSPDCGDALALTFAYPVLSSQHAGGPFERPKVRIDYDPFEVA